MPMSPRLALKLRHTLGEDAAEDLVNWMHDVDARNGSIRRDIAELRHEMRQGFTRLESALDTRIAKSTADLMQWSFVFWAGAVIAIAGLAGVLR